MNTYLKNNPIFVLMILLFVFFSFISPPTLHKDWLGELPKKLLQFYQSTPQEKVYLHTDKPHYALGETIWFKAYLSADITEIPDSLLSAVLYVELITPKDTLHKRLQLKVEERTTFGDFGLADSSLVAGNYRLRAYTNYMRNFEEDYFFEKTVKVYSPQDKIDTTKTTVEKFEVKFFPEGGDLVSMLRSVVAFKASNQFGQGVPIEGSLFEKGSETEILSFKSNDLGMGNFKFFPLKDKVFIAKVRFPNGSSQTYELPPARAEGFVISIDPTENSKVKIRIATNLSTTDAKAKQIHLIAQQRGKIYVSLTDSSTQASTRAEIPTAKLPSGIVHFTLFDGYGRPHCERLVYISKESPKDVLQINAEKQSYAPREKVQLYLQLDDSLKEIVQGNYSIAIVDAEKVKGYSTYEENIISYFLLSSEIKGRIEQPAYYLQNTPEAQLALDNLMLTQGWRRFKWKDVLADTLRPISYLIEQSLSFSGRASGLFTSGLKNGQITIFNKPLGIFETMETDEKGKFEVLGLHFLDTATITIQARTRNKGDFTGITLDEKNFPEVKNRQTNEVLFPFAQNYVENYQKFLLAEKAFQLEKNVKLLKEVTVKSTKIKEAKDDEPFKLHSTADAVLKGDVIQSGAIQGNVLYALQGRVAGLQLIPGGLGNPPRVRIRGISTFRGSTEPLYLFDGMPVDANFFTGISPSDVASIEVLKDANTAIYGVQGANGVIAVYSKKGAGFSTGFKQKNLLNYTMTGYYRAKEFYQPDYDTLSKDAQLKPDLRTTIYWNPHVKVKKGEKTRLSFFCADNPTTYHVILEGVNHQRNWVRKETQIKVERK
jgi:TonB-dependent SusC/RagA subfamily outer membrane receptor